MSHGKSPAPYAAQREMVCEPTRAVKLCGATPSRTPAKARNTGADMVVATDSPDIEMPIRHVIGRIDIPFSRFWGRSVGGHRQAARRCELVPPRREYQQIDSPTFAAA